MRRSWQLVVEDEDEERDGRVNSDEDCKGVFHCFWFCVRFPRRRIFKPDFSRHLLSGRHPSAAGKMFESRPPALRAKHHENHGAGRGGKV